MGNVFTVVFVASLVGYLGVSGALAYASRVPYLGDIYPVSFGDKGQRAGASAGAVRTLAQAGRGVSFKNLPL